MRYVFLHSNEIEKYHYPPECPFKTERAAMTGAILESLGILHGNGKSVIAPEPATINQLLMFHTRNYLEMLQRVSKGNLQPEDLFAGIGTDDCPVFSDLFAYGSLAAGASIMGAKMIQERAADIVFNPSGGYHHAFPDKAGGFCYINDVVIACKILSEKGHKVLCLDLDAHHGNGTQAAFHDTPYVFTVSMHESGETLFPWGGFENETGEGSGKGYNMNIPLPAGSDDDVFRYAFEELVPPVLEAYNPDYIVLEIGMDILAVDPLTHLSMTNNAFADVMPYVKNCGKPVLVVGGGGYHPQSTARGWAYIWSILTGSEPQDDMTVGMGGVFLGNHEWGAGLRDMRAFSSGERKKDNLQKTTAAIDRLKTLIFPVHGIGF